MAEILGKDLDLYDDSMVAEKPFNLAESDITGPRFITGEDLARSTRISKEWKDPVAIPSQASVPYMKAVQPLVVGTRAMVDSIANIMPNMANAIAQTSLEVMEGEEKKPELTDTIDALNTITKPLVKILGVGLWAADIDRKELMERAKTYDEAITLLENRDYPSHNIARRVIANTTADVESRRAVRELYRQAGNIDSSKWYNKAGEIIGAMVPALTIGKGAFGTARAFGASRLAASRIAQNVAKGYIGVEMGGQYAEETAAQYLERTGDKKFENFTASDATGITAMAYGAIGAQIEMMGGVEPIFAGALNKVGLKSGLLKAGVKIGAGEATEELLQGLTETLMRKIDGSSNKTWREGFMESLNSAAWGLFIGGSLGTASFHVGRANLVKGIKQALPNITDTQAGEIANVMIDNTAEVSSQDPTLRSNLRQKVALMYRDIDIENKEDIIDATTDLEYGLIAMDSAERGVDIAENPIFAGEVNELGWFRDAVPENRRKEITALNDEIKGLKEQLAEEQKKEEKNWEKIDELESKLSQVNEYVLDKLSDLARNDAMAVRRMLRKTEQKFVNKEKEKATKKAIQDGNVDIIGNILSKAGFRTRDLSGTQIKKLAKMNWELLQDQNLGVAQSRGTTQVPLANIERNVESGNAVLLRAGYTQDQIDKMDDETWNRAILTQYRKESPAQPEYTEEDIASWEGVEFQEQFDLADENARLDDIYPEYTGETIEVDGKERSVYNSNGDRIAKSEPALRNFYKWFGDSKVVDEQGRPLVVYHGARGKTDITEFRPQEYGYNVEATYFATNKSAAGHWAESSYTKRNINPDEYIKRVYEIDSVKELLDMYNSFGAKTEIVEYDGFYRLNEHDGMISSPLGKKITESTFEVNGRTIDLVKELQRKISRIVYESANSDLYSVYAKLENPLIIDAKKQPYHSIEFNGEKTTTATIAQFALDNNYDGLIIKNVYETDYENVLTDDVLVFEPTQIKSVNNRGTFDESEGNIYWQSGFASMRGELEGGALDAERFEGVGEGSSVWGWGSYLLKSEKIDKAHYYNQFNYSGKPITYEGKELSQLFNTSLVANTIKEMMEEGRTYEQTLQKIESGIDNLERKIKYITDSGIGTIRSQVPNAEEIVKDILKLVESKGVYYIRYEKDSPEYAIQEKYAGTDGYRFSNDFKMVWDALLAYAHTESELKAYLDLLNLAEKDLAIFKNLDIKKFTGGNWFRYKNQNLEQFITNLMDEFITSSRYYGGKEINNDIQKIIRDAIVKGKSFKQELKDYIDNKIVSFEKEIEEIKQQVIKDLKLNENQIKVLDDILAQAKLGGSSAKDTESILAVDKISKGKYGHQYDTEEAQTYRDIYNKREYVFKALETSAQRNKALKALYKEFKDADIKDFDLKTKASMYKFDVPENKYLLDFTKSLAEQSKFVKDAIAKLYEETNLGEEPYNYTIKAINPNLPRIYKASEILKEPKSQDDVVKTYDGIIDTFIMDWKKHDLNYAKKELDSLIVRQTHYAQEAKDNLKSLEKEKKGLDENASRMYYVNRDIEYNTTSSKTHADYRDIAKFVKKKVDKIPENANLKDYADITYDFKYDETGWALYKSIQLSFQLTHDEKDIKLAKELNALNKEGNIRPQKATSKLLEKYGIKGVKYEGERDKTGFVIFGKVPALERLYQNRVSGAGPRDYRGAYIPAYRFIQRANRMDASSLSHELAHDWMEVNFDRFRSGKATPEFMRAWGALEKALGIEENATQVPRKASETFARAYEAWIMTNEDWAKLINIDDKDKDAVEKLLKDYQGELRNIYNDINNKYFKDTWGKLGELKPELKAWFDRAVNITDLDVLVKRGEMTEEQAAEERLNRAIDKVIETTTDEETANTLRTARLLNDTARYEVEGGNKNSLQNRLSALAREIDENNTLLKKDRYNTRRDMMQVAEAADNFVKTRLDDALAIINGEMAEVEGLYKEDIYTALERLAIENGDMGLITELKNSEIANRLAKELGQRVAGFRNWKQSDDIDILSALKSTDNIYNKALENKKAKEQFNSALDLFEESLKNQDEKADSDLDSMLKEWECK